MNYLEKYKEAQTIVTKINDFVIENLGFSVSVNISVTDFGTSLYITNLYGKKIRISDHSVTNHNRIFEEIHYSINDWDNELFLNDVEYLFCPEKFTNVNVEYKVKNTSTHIFNDLEDYFSKYATTKEGVGTIEKIEDFTNKKGVNKLQITWSYYLTQIRTKTIKIK